MKANKRIGQTMMQSERMVVSDSRRIARHHKKQATRFMRREGKKIDREE